MLVRETRDVAAVLVKADGCDIVKKSSNRKNRYLLIFCAQIAPKAGGVLVCHPLMTLPTGSLHTVLIVAPHPLKTRCPSINRYHNTSDIHTVRTRSGYRKKSPTGLMTAIYPEYENAFDCCCSVHTNKSSGVISSDLDVRRVFPFVEVNVMTDI